MKTTVTVIGVAIVLLVAQQAGQAQHPGSAAAWGTGLSASAEDSPLLIRGQNHGACGCRGEQCPVCCPNPYCIDRWQAFADLLYFQPRNVDVTIGVPIAGVIDIDPPPVGPALVVDSEYHPGFRVGFARALDECATVGITYSHLETHQTINPSVDPTTQTIFPLVIDPTQVIPGTTFDSAFGRQNVDFRILDADFRHVFRTCDRYALSYSIGARYAHLRQDFVASFFAPATADDQNVFTRIRFDGGGIRLGLEGERHAANTCLMVYGKAAASFVAGDFRATYLEAQPDQLPSVDTSWKAGRVISMLDLEIGGGWASPDGNFRVTAGYMVSGWFNVVKTSEWIQAVQTNNYTGLSDGIGFDGVVLRTEFRF